MNKLMTALKPAVLGFSSSCQQTCASIAMLERTKRDMPAVTGIIGGWNCSGEMATGIASLSPCIDHVFSGEADGTFVEFLEASVDERRRTPRIIRGSTPELGSLAQPAFDEYFEQLHILGLDEEVKNCWLPLESSRGCWWGQKSMCSFCGLNGHEMVYRQKAPEVVHRELVAVTSRYCVNNVRMSDPLMPREYVKDLLPLVARDLPGLSLFYEQRADIGISELIAMRTAGIRFMQVGRQRGSETEGGQAP